MGMVSSADPMTELDTFLGCTSLAESFHPGDEAIFNNESCFGTTCDSFRTKSEVIADSPKRVVIRSYDGDGNIFQEEGLTEERWTQVRCNRARLHLQSLEISGFQIHISEPRHSKRKISVNGHTLEVQTRIIDITGSNRLGMKVNHTLELAKNVGGLAQLIVREQRSGASGVDRYVVEAAKY